MPNRQRLSSQGRVPVVVGMALLVGGASGWWGWGWCPASAQPPMTPEAAAQALELDEALAALLREVEAAEGESLARALYRLRDYFHGRPAWERPTGPISEVVVRHALISEDHRHRRIAFEIFGRMQDPALIPLLTIGLGDDGPGVRRTAAMAMAQLGRQQPLPETTVEALREMLPGPDSGAAVDALSALLQERATSILLNAWRGDRLHPHARSSAAIHMARYPHASAADVMRGLLEPAEGEGRAGATGPSPNIRAAALYFAALDEWPLSAEMLTEALARFPRPDPERRGPEDGVREAAAEYLGRVRDQRAVPLLRDAVVSDPAFRVRTAAMGALGRLGDAGAVALIDSQLDLDDRGRSSEGHPDGSLHAAAIEALGVLARTEVPGALPALYHRLAEEEAPFARRLWSFWGNIDGEMAQRAVGLYLEQPLPDHLGAGLLDLLVVRNARRFELPPEREAVIESFRAWHREQPPKQGPQDAEWVEQEVRFYALDDGAAMAVRSVGLRFPQGHWPDRHGSGHSEIYLFRDGQWRLLGTVGHWTS